MNHYWMSDGELISQRRIDAKIRKAKKQKLDAQVNEFGYNFCEDCGRNGNGTYLDCSHDIAVKKAEIEMAWNLDNITIRCRDCHNDYGDGRVV